MPAPDTKDVHEQLNKARKHTGKPLTNVVGDGTGGIGVGIALLLVDLINDIEFEGNEYMVEHAKEMAPRIKDMAQECRDLGVPVIYCNDNFGKWRSNLEQIYDTIASGDTPGSSVAQLLKPSKDDYFILKPKHSAFYATALESLLTYLQVKSLIIVGMAGNVCILFSANDAYMRDYALYVPRDCIASSSREEADAAILLMDRALGTCTKPSTELNLRELVQAHEKKGLANEKELKKRREGSAEKEGDGKKAKTGLASDPGAVA
ncbi:Isochorismatase-like protein [Fimicolochytrium jonesii]|uniref:Isochorismatase-like protein n=1 Tax=Fimicolochytrium jonesii TaxID=1396493 RepID=UPI0022FED38B|nr:Isochorismatase-like protein [Fimicolochytrium jonesii]KAI8822236.1 Isochorismatase-like protein [Fimicolochytrium jonesii]